MYINQLILHHLHFLIISALSLVTEKKFIHESCLNTANQKKRTNERTKRLRSVNRKLTNLFNT